MISNRRHYRLLNALAERPMAEAEIIELLNCRPTDLRFSLEEVLETGMVMVNDGIYELTEAGMSYMDGYIAGPEMYGVRRAGRFMPGPGMGRGRRFCQPAMRRGRRGFGGRGYAGRRF